MAISTRLKKIVKKVLWRKPRPRTYEEDIYSRIVRRGDVCFDIGANRGNVSLLLAKLIANADTSVVIAFEPLWPAYRRLCRSIQLDISIKAPIYTINAGLSNQETSGYIHVPDRHFSMGSMATPEQWVAAQNAAAVVSYQAKFITLDSFLESTHLQPPDFIKIDVEGAELFVLQGAHKMFAAGARPLMLLEIFAPWEQAFGYQPWEPLSWLVERGYSLLFAYPEGLLEYVPTQSAPFPPNFDLGYNVVAYIPELHKERIKELRPLMKGQATRMLPMGPAPKANRIEANQIE